MPDALFIGITTDRFWSMTFVELIDEIDAFNRRREAEEREQLRTSAAMIYKLAQFVNLAVLEPKKFPGTLQQAFPDLFAEERKAFDWQDNKQSWAAYAQIHNQQIGGAQP